MNDVAKNALTVVACHAVAYAILIGIGHVAHKRNMKKLDKEYRELCETVK